MTSFQKAIKYLAMGFAIFLTVSIIGGIIAAAVGLFGGFFEGAGVLEDFKTYAVSDHITELDIEIAAADFTIVKADSFGVESNLKHLTVNEKNGILEIKEKKRIFVANADAALVLYIPEGTSFDKVEIETGAGRFTVDELVADELQLELGAGEVKITSLTANNKADIDGGAGRITIDGGSLRNLDLNLGVGQLNLTAEILGNCDFDLGIGESNITFIGIQDDYTIHAEKGIGNLTIDGKGVGDFNSIGNGENKIDISGGIGAINLVFKEE